MWPNFTQIVEKCAQVAETLNNNGEINDYEFDPTKLGAGGTASYSGS